jgi:hypothetical protein
MMSDSSTTAAPKVKKPQVPMTFADRIPFFVFAAILIGLAAWMFFRPQILSIDPAELGGRRARGWAYIVEMIWSQPVGVLIALVGLFFAWGGISAKTKDDPKFKDAPPAPPSNG